MKGITTFLMFSSRGEEAVRFYVSVFPRAAITQLTLNEASGGPIAKGGLLMASFELDGARFNACDGGPYFKFSEGMSLFVNCETQAEIDHLWTRLVEGGGEHSMCGWLRDRFGVSWQIVPTLLGELLASPDKAQAQRTMQAMLQMTKLDIAALAKAARG